MMFRISREILLMIVGFALASIPIVLPYPEIKFFPIIAVVIASIPMLSLKAKIAASGLSKIIKPQKEHEVLVLYHTSTGVIVPIEGVESFEGTIKLKNYAGRIINPRRSTYLLFGKRVVHAIQGLGIVVPPKVALLSNVLTDKGYKTIGEALIAEYGEDLDKLPEGELKDKCKKIIQEETRVGD